MPNFSYRATDQGGKTIEGKMEAQDAGAVATRLHELAHFPVEIRESSTGGGRKSLRARGLLGGRKYAIIHFTRQMAVLLGAGLTVDRSLLISGELVDDDSFSKAVGRVRRDVEEGKNIADAMSRHRKYFSDLYVNMVSAGEASGTLDSILKRLAEFLEEWQRFRDVIVTALLYPAFLLVFAGAAVLFILLFVIPRFAQVFIAAEQPLPLPTTILLHSGLLLKAYWWVPVLVTAAALLAARFTIRSQKGKEALDRLILSLPLVGGMAVKVQVSRFARLLGTLVGSGVPILKSLEIVSGTLTNSVFSKSVSKIRSGLRQGQGISEPLRRAAVFPPLFIHMVTVGEETGKLEEMLLSIATSYDRDVERESKRLLSIFEPIIILLLGLVVGSIVLSVLWGIFSVQTLF